MPPSPAPSPSGSSSADAVAGAIATASLPPDLPAEDNFEAWRQAVSSVFEVRPRRAGGRERFGGALVSHRIGPFLLSASRSDPMTTCRDEALVGAVGVDHVLFQLYRAGGGEIEAEGRAGRVRAGDLVCFDLSRRHAATLDDLETVSLVVPRALLQVGSRVLDDAHGAVIPGGSAMGTLIGSQLRQLADTAPRFTPADVAPVTALVANAVSLGLSVAERAPEAPRGGLLTLTLQMVRGHIESRLADPTLSPDAICRHFALSRSALYRLFEPIGGIADYVRDRRLERAALHILSVGTGRGAVARLAARCGFGNEAAFSRAFRQRYGLPPREAILQAHLRRQEAGPDPLETGWLLGWMRDLSSASPAPGFGVQLD